MIIRIVKLTLDPEKVDEFKTIYQQTMEKIRHYEGCTHLELLQNEANILMTYSYWVSQEALEEYRQSDLFRSTWSKVKPMFIDKPVAWSLTQQFKI